MDIPRVKLAVHEISKKLGFADRPELALFVTQSGEPWGQRTDEGSAHETASDFALMTRRAEPRRFRSPSSLAVKTGENSRETCNSRCGLLKPPKAEVKHSSPVQ